MSIFVIGRQRIILTGVLPIAYLTVYVEFYPGKGVPTGGALAVTCFGLKINEIFRALFVDDLAIGFHRGFLDTIERHLQQAVNAIQEWATMNGFKVAANKCKVIHFTALRYKVQRHCAIRIGDTFLPVEELARFLGLWWGSHLSFKKHISGLKIQCREALNLIWVVARLKWGRDRDTLLMLYWTIVYSKLDYGCIVYGTASNTNIWQMDSIHNTWLRLALGAFCTSPVSSLYTEANKAPLGESRLKLSIHYYLETRACIENPAHHALQKFICSHAKWERKDDPAPDNSCWSQCRGIHGFGRDQYRISLPLWGYPAFHQECTITITRDTTSLKEWENVWSPDKGGELQTRGGELFWHWGKWTSVPASKRDPWPWHRSSGKRPLCRVEATGPLLCPCILNQIYFLTGEW